MTSTFIRVFPIILFSLLFAACSSSVQTSRTTGSRTSAASYASLSSARKTVLNESQRWMGTPYRYGGTTRAGADCSGFVSTVYAKAGVKLPRRARDMFTEGKPVSLKRIRPGDLVFFKNTAGKGITHVGIYTGRAKFIHASSSAGVITSSLNQTYYSKHYAGARKILK